MIRLRGWDPVMGMNLRNARIARQNPSAAIRLVNDKYATKDALTSVGAPTSPTLALLRSRREVATLDWDGLPASWALKPNQSLGGNGILLAFGRRRSHWPPPPASGSPENWSPTSCAASWTGSSPPAPTTGPCSNPSSGRTRIWRGCPTRGCPTSG
ncbi:hypothetical protein [Streptomyces sp. NBC_01207]|uniref:hypothetical protein n=1 Tax=Streptomyces sp. NBC_01207 TaxID=2903772 RepID=UPI002E140778|nr:hypothetical protein OG457_07390 [Streptomyces sp. NBC_01207]